jgi:hypothetical protein
VINKTVALAPDQMRWSLPAKTGRTVMIDALAFALATVAIGIPAIITAATLGAKLEVDW